MNYVNNWQRAVVLAAGATSLALDLPDGDYRLTLADSATSPTRWEIIDATVASGAAVISRAREGTTDQTWPAGSVIYCALTAGQVATILSDLASLSARLAALEPSPFLGWDAGKVFGFLEVSPDPQTLTVVGELSAAGYCIGSHPVAGTCYFEVQVFSVIEDVRPCNIGIAPADYAADAPEIRAVALFGNAGYINNNLVAGEESSASAVPVDSGDLVRVAVDWPNLRVWFAVNDGAWLGGGNPATGTTPTITFDGSRPLFPFARVEVAGSTAVGKFDSSSWTYAAPVGFTAIPIA